MSVIKIEERTLYPPLVNYLKSIDFQAFGETTIEKDHPDLFFNINNINFVVEVKIGDKKIGLKAVAQASDYAKKLNTQNIIILIYPEKYRNQPITNMELLEELALDKEIDILILTEFWTEYLFKAPNVVFKDIKEIFQNKKIKIDFNSIVKLIGNYVTDIKDIVYQIKTDELISEVVNRLDLFSSIGEIKDLEIAKKQVLNLASYLLFNQLLFYYIFKKKSQDKLLPELTKILNISDLQNYFDKILSIDYKSIYRINLLAHIPNSNDVITLLNELIIAIKLLRAEHITHDLAGRFFHDLIPSEVRKVLAAFYTHPIAADILTKLTINSYDETIIDPACGSGTLLVASYQRKQNLYEQLYGFSNQRIMHKKFIENDITGIDIMPFAAHMTTINLTTQNIEQETNIVRIATKDSLDLGNGLLNRSNFEKKGIKILPYTETIQDTLFGIYGRQIEKEGAISANGKGEESFVIKSTDIVIMNPPFTDREKMPTEMRNKIKKNMIGDYICGHSVNLWGYFLAIGDLLLKQNGKMGVVIPLNIARGSATDKIRNYILSNYYIKFIIKSLSDVAFSEGCSFKDILLIAEKRKPVEEDLTGIVFLKKSIRKMNNKERDNIISRIEKHYLSKEEKSFEDFEIHFEKYKNLNRLKNNLMPILGLTSIQNIKILNDFLNLLSKRYCYKLKKISSSDIEEGFHASPAGLSELTFITRPIKDSRIGRAFLILTGEEKEYIKVKLKDTDFVIKIDRNKIVPALRTITSVDNFFIGNKKDYFVIENYSGFEKVLIHSKWKDKKFNWKLINKDLDKKKSYLTIARRFRPNSDNTHFFSFYLDDKFISPHTFKILKLEEEESKIQCMFLNSIFSLINILRFGEQTTGGYTDIMESDLLNFDILNYEKIEAKEIERINDLFLKLKEVKFPSILEQLELRFNERILLDKTIFQILGFTNSEINHWLPKLYDTIINELKAVLK